MTKNKEDLQKAIEKAKQNRPDLFPPEKKPEQEFDSSYSGLQIVSKIMIDLLAGIVIGGLVGYYIDDYLNSWPLFFLICFIFGVAGSAVNIYRNVK